MRPALIVIACVTFFRIFAAAYMPIRQDEMYYWVWSRHLAYGYLDHPPVLAWLIAATSFLGKSALALRLVFIVCRAVAALAVGAAALALGANRLGAALAAITFALIPQTENLVSYAGTDPPYLMFWALALLCSARAVQRPRTATFVLLGVALAGATLSRFFGWALVFGILAWAMTPPGRPLRGGLWIALAVLGVLYAPFVYWNATHHWMTFVFTFAGRQGFSMPLASHLESVHSVRLFIFSALFAAAMLASARSGRMTLAAWTGLPLMTAFVLLAFFQNVETYWFLGPFTSLCVAFGPWLMERRPFWRFAFMSLWTISSLATAGAIVDAILSGGGGPLYERHFAFRSIARDVRTLSARGRATPVTQDWGLAGTLAFNDVPVLLIGASPQVTQWRQWYGDRVPPRALFVAEEPPATSNFSGKELHVAYARIVTGPALAYAPSPTSRVTFYTTWCDGPKLKRFGESGASTTATTRRAR